MREGEGGGGIMGVSDGGKKVACCNLLNVELVDYCVSLI